MSVDFSSDQDNSYHEFTIEDHQLDAEGLEELEHFNGDSIELTFEGGLRSLYFDNKTFEQMEEQLLNTLQQVKSPDHLEQLIRNNIQFYAEESVKNDLLDKINYVRHENLQDRQHIQQEVVQKIFDGQCVIEDKSKEADKVIQLYFSQPHLKKQYSSLLKNFNCQDYHNELFEEVVYNDNKVIKDFLDQIVECQKADVEASDSRNQISKAYSLVHKQKEQPQRQLPQPSCGHSPYEEYQFEVRNSRFSFAKQSQPKRQNNNPDYNNIRASLRPFYEQYDAQEDSKKKKRRNKKKKNTNEKVEKQQDVEASQQKLEESDESKAKCSDEIKEFERRLEQAHEGLKDEEKLTVNVSKDWVRKMQQLRQKTTLRNAGAQRR